MLRLDEYSKLDGTGLATLIRRGDLSAREAAQCAVTAAEKLNPALNAVLEIYSDALDLPCETSGPFAGVPTLRKDVGATERDRLQEHGSRLFLGHRPKQDSHFTGGLRAAGLVIIGRTAVPELAISSATESAAFGITRNPWHPERMAGGSSGGAAAAVASGIVPIAHASDGGGSIRIPATACGVIGLKPSRGRVSCAPDVDEVLFGLATEFVLCRSVRDAAAMLDALSRPAPGDPFRIEAPSRPRREIIEAPLRPLRIAVATMPWGPFPVDEEIAAKVLEAASQCEAMGHLVEPGAPDMDFEAVVGVLTELFATGLARLDEAAAALGRRPAAGLLEPITLANYRLARSMSVADLAGTLGKANEIRRKAGPFFERYDVLLTPALATAPVRHGEYSQSRTDVDPYGFQRALQRTDQFLPLFNITGQPALTLPLGPSREGLPIGVQLVGRLGDEATILQLARRLEEANPRGYAQPPVHAAR